MVESREQQISINSPEELADRLGFVPDEENKPTSVIKIFNKNIAQDEEEVASEMLGFQSRKSRKTQTFFIGASYERSDIQDSVLFNFQDRFPELFSQLPLQSDPELENSAQISKDYLSSGGYEQLKKIIEEMEIMGVFEAEIEKLEVEVEQKIKIREQKRVEAKDVVEQILPTLREKFPEFNLEISDFDTNEILRWGTFLISNPSDPNLPARAIFAHAESDQLQLLYGPIKMKGKNLNFKSFWTENLRYPWYPRSEGYLEDDPELGLKTLETLIYVDERPESSDEELFEALDFLNSRGFEIKGRKNPRYP